MSRIYSVLVLLFIVISTSRAQSIPDSISTNDKIYYLSEVWSEIKYNFVNMDQVTFDPDSLYKTYIPKVQESKNDFEYYQVLKQFVASFGDGHTAVVDQSQFYLWKDYFSMNLSNVGEKVYIVRVLKDPILDSTWVGAEVIKISGVRTKRFLQDSIFPYISASTKQHLWMQGVQKIHQDLKWKDFKATIVKTTGDTVKIQLPRNGEATRTPEDDYWGMKFPKRRKMVDLEKLEGDISYLNIRSFYPENIAIQDISKYLPEIYESNGLIIDLRRNGGGSTNAAWYLQSLLSKEKSFLNYGWETRVNDGVKKANSNWKEEYQGYLENREVHYVEPDTIEVPDSIRRIDIPVVVLIGRYTFSAAEDFLVNMYEVPDRPLFIGQETAGSTGSPLVVPNLPNGGYCRICTRRICYPYSGKRFVNHGVIPDVIVNETIGNIIKSNDVVLEKAIEILKDK
ncbi:MAG: hypothetical protein JEY96_08860 [Bacteroidales bacterium]|nr:hypothetical protein [Bacteroidales bacterium]